MNAIRACLFIFTLCFAFSSASAGGLGEKLGGLLGSNANSDDDILRPEVAFQFFPEAYADGQLIVRWQIEPGYYLYKDKLVLSPDDERIVPGDYQLPAGKLKTDPIFGQVEVYYGDASVTVPLSSSPSLPAAFDMTISFQGCKEDSICYPPMQQSYSVAVQSGQAPAVASNANTISVSEQDAITAALKDKGLILNVLSFFGFGFLLALTPCVFPMIPILSGIIVGQAERITRGRALSLSVLYVLAMALTYALLGVIAGLFSVNLQAASQNPWILSLFSLIFVMLALSMFGLYQLQLPASWQSRLMSGSSQAGTFKSAIVMGVLSAIIVGPCVAPPLAGALLYISHTGDALLGGLALFAMGLGFGVPLLVVGATSGELLPRAGIWMESIKRAFGVIMLGVAIWFLERIVPASAALLLWATLFVATAVFMGALDRIDAQTNPLQKLLKALGIVLLVYGMVLVVAAANGKGTVLKPFKSFSMGSAAVAEKKLAFQSVSGLDELNKALAEAGARQQLVMLDFYADWCIACIELEEYTFSDPAVQNALASVKLLQTDVTKNTDVDKALLEAFELFGPPAILFFNTDAREIRSHRLVGFIKPEDFVRHVQQVKDL